MRKKKVRDSRRGQFTFDISARIDEQQVVEALDDELRSRDYLKKRTSVDDDWPSFLI